MARGKMIEIDRMPQRRSRMAFSKTKLDLGLKLMHGEKITLTNSKIVA